MNWDALGSIGEVLGAVAVLVTLIFLIFQLRQNTRAIEVDSVMSNFAHGSAWLYKVVGDPALARLYLAGLSDALETDDDRLRFHLLMQALFNQWAVAYTFRTDSIRGVADTDVEHVLATPGGKAYWARAKTRELHADPFVEYVDSIANRVGEDT